MDWHLEIKRPPGLSVGYEMWGNENYLLVLVGF
jgi:hypothetical protein